MTEKVIKITIYTEGWEGQMNRKEEDGKKDRKVEDGLEAGY